MREWCIILKYAAPSGTSSGIYKEENNGIIQLKTC